jgi:hypothetical protein
MDEVVRIAPLAIEPGLIGYECPVCCYVTSVLLQPKAALGPARKRLRQRRCFARAVAETRQGFGAGKLADTIRQITKAGMI